VRLPNGREIIEGASVRLPKPSPCFCTGPSGFRQIHSVPGNFRHMALMATERFTLPAGAKMMMLPQRPIFRSVLLRAAVTYPESPDRYDEAAIVDALRIAKLSDFIGELDVGGYLVATASLAASQQRLAVAAPYWRSQIGSSSMKRPRRWNEDMEAEI